MARCSTVGWLSMLGNLSREWEERWYLTKIKSDNNVSNVLVNRRVLVVVGALEDDDGSPEEQERLRWRYSSLSFRKIQLGSCFVCCVLRVRVRRVLPTQRSILLMEFSRRHQGVQQEFYPIENWMLGQDSCRKMETRQNYSLLFRNAVSL